ncbi:DNA-directed RNA polymerase subunit alpha [Dehalococcoidia bacterium]|nr:DNA-directed RNA polymerase subunit alpha [Dehalococcoidia bacterium]
MPEIVSASIDYRLVSENYGHFVIEPLDPGYGLTLGNALRRVLLGSLPGAAVTAVKIEGIQHEFSTIPHMKEDTLEFLLNVKGIRLRCLSDRSDKLVLEASGEGEVRAGDIKPSAEFEIANPDHYLATLDSPEASLNVEFTVEIGKGYVRAGPSDGQFIGVLPLDAVFTPIRRVNYKVEKTKIADRSDYDRLIIDVLTDGTISPEDAVATSARILAQQFSTFLKLGKQPEEAVAVAEKPSPLSEKLDMPLDQLGFNSRTYNALRRAGITSVRILLGKTREELIDTKYLGPKSWEEIQERLAAIGVLEKPQVAETEGEGGGEVPAEEEISEDAEREEMMKKLQESGFVVRENK